MNLQINRITNCNVYIDGVGQVGRAEEVTVAQPKHMMVDHKGLGMAGHAEFWAGVDKMEAKIKWASIYADTVMLMANPFATHQIVVMGSLETYTSLGRTAQLPLTYLLTAMFKESGDPVFKKNENVDLTSTLTVYHSEMSVAGVQIFMFDVMANQYIVGGVDQLAQFR